MFGFLTFAHLFQPLSRTETIICMVFYDEFLCIFPIASEAVRLSIWLVRSPNIRSFVMRNTQPIQRSQNTRFRAFYEPRPVGIFYTDNKLAPCLFCHDIVNKGCIRVTDMEILPAGEGAIRVRVVIRLILSSHIHILNVGHPTQGAPYCLWVY